MDQSSPSQNEPENLFYCHLCSVSCASALNLQSHFLGVKHRKAEASLRNNKKDNKKPFEIKPNATLQEHIDACKDSEPAVGLEYIYQYQKHGYNTYECKLCECRAGLTHMFMHVIGAKHRITYLGKHHPSLGISGPYIMKGPKKLKKLRDVCLTLEKEFGRQKINVMEGIENPRSSNAVTTASSAYYTPESELERIEFASDDYFDVDGKLAAPQRVVTFLELKAAHEVDQKKAASSKGSSQTTGEPEKDLDGRSKKDAHKKEGDSKESSESSKDFTNNKDLLDFLEHFRILRGEDAKFVKLVVEMLSIALMQHKKVCKENEEKKLSISNAINEQCLCKEQDPVPSVVPPHANQDTFTDTPAKFIQKQKQIPVSQFGNGKTSESYPSSSLIPGPQVKRGAPFVQTKSASPSFPPKASPALFPIANNDIVNRFFESIKNMEVTEVISTLNKIAATNPAFKGIHVPSLVHYLKETGKLKTTQQGNQY